VAVRVLILGAGFGGLELATTLSEGLGDGIDVTLIDRNAAFSFGYSKLDVMFGRQTLPEVRLPYAGIAKPGVRFLQETVLSIDAEARRVTTDGGVHEADFLVIALGADYDLAATPGLVEGGNEFYSFEGAARLGELIPSFTNGHAIVGVCDAPFKCPPAPSECALLLHDDLVARGVREDCQISVVMPFPRLVPPSPETSAALLEAFIEREIAFVPDRRINAIDPLRSVAVLDDGTEMPFDLFLGVPKHRAPDVVLHRVRTRTRRPCRRRLLLRPEADGCLQRALGRTRPGQGALRLEPKCPLVRQLTRDHWRQPFASAVLIAASVTGPATPSAVRLFAVWKAETASTVDGP